MARAWGPGDQARGGGARLAAAGEAVDRLAVVVDVGGARRAARRRTARGA
jgi:hypothetical protein